MSLNSTQLREHLRHLTTTGGPSWRLPLWDYALALYAKKGVAAACLHLQDEFGADVCELLWICWLACHDLAPDRDAPLVLAPVRDWQHETTQPLRDLRRRLKLQAVTSGLESLRETVKRAELQSERETLLRLQRLSDRAQGVRLLEPHDPALAARLFEWLPASDKNARQPLAILETRFDRPMVEP